MSLVHFVLVTLSRYGRFLLNAIACNIVDCAICIIIGYNPNLLAYVTPQRRFELTTLYPPSLADTRTQTDIL